MKQTNRTLATTLSGPIEEGEAFRRLSESVAQSGASPRRARRRGAFHIGIAIAFIATAFAGFAPSYYMRGLSDRPPLSPLMHMHGMVFSAWLCLLLTQSLLVGAHRVQMHRRLGMAGAVLATIMVPLGIAAAFTAASRPPTSPGQDPRALLIFQVGAVIMFAAFIGAAIWKRKSPDIHRRLILLGTICIIPPAIARLPLVELRPVLALALSLLFLLAGIVHDWRARGRVHRVYVWGGLIIVLSAPIRFGIGQTDAWQSFTRQLVATKTLGRPLR